MNHPTPILPHEVFCKKTTKAWGKSVYVLLMATRNPESTHQLRLVVEIPIIYKGFRTIPGDRRISGWHRSSIKEFPPTSKHMWLWWPDFFGGLSLVPSGAAIIWHDFNQQRPLSTTGNTKGIIKLPKLGWNDTLQSSMCSIFSWDFPEIILEFSPQKNLWGKKSWSNWTHFSRRVGSAHHLRGCYFATSSKYSDHYACNVRLPRWRSRVRGGDFPKHLWCFFRDQMITSGWCQYWSYLINLQLHIL